MNQFFDINRDIKLHKTYHGGPYIDFIAGSVEEPNGLNHLENEVWYYLSDITFYYFFAKIFGKCAYYFDIVGPPISYNREEQRIIVERLRENQMRFENVRSSKDFLALSDYYNKPPNTSFTDFLESKNIEIDWKKDWLLIINKLLQLNKDLSAMVQICIDNGKILWVLGV